MRGQRLYRDKLRIYFVDNKYNIRREMKTVMSLILLRKDSLFFGCEPCTPDILSIRE